MNLLIVIPTKSSQHYLDRMVACRATWLKDVLEVDEPCGGRYCTESCQPALCHRPVAYKAFRDSDLDLIEIDQHDNANDPIRTQRTQRMVKFAYDKGFDFVFRVDTDAFVWVNRLLVSGFENHDYMGWCLDVPRHIEREWCMTTAHGGIGFTLSRKAMKIVVDAPVEKYVDGKYWGDLWAGQQLWKHGIHCHRDTRFLDGSKPPMHHGNIAADKLPLDHPYISIHPVDPVANFYALHERFPKMPAETVAPTQQIWWQDPPNYNYGQKRPNVCPCNYCRS